MTPFLLNYFTSGNDREKEFWLNWHRRIVMELVNWLDYKHDGAASFSWGKMIFNEYNNIVIIPAELSASV
ncbi:hypothetical protein HOL46_04655 [Candidatus Falkowbacteria bacterium]|nr:hypothetical protein [Candidatus Falkowbacteria bacterium]